MNLWLLDLGTYCLMVPRLAASISPDSLLEMQTLGPHSLPTESESAFLQALQGPVCSLQFEKHWCLEQSFPAGMPGHAGGGSEWQVRSVSCSLPSGQPEEPGEAAAPLLFASTESSSPTYLSVPDSGKLEHLLKWYIWSKCSLYKDFQSV